MADREHRHSTAPLDEGVIAFLQYAMTPDERVAPRALPVLRLQSEVSIGELRVHPDLIDRLAHADGPESSSRLRLLMGAAVLVNEAGIIYALAYSQSFLAVRLPSLPGDAIGMLVRDLAAQQPSATAPWQQPADRIAALGAEWTRLEPWANSVDTLRPVFALARSYADGADYPRA